MPRALNRIELIGRIAADPESSTSNAELQICTFWLVTEETWKDKTGAHQEAVDWHRIVAWDHLAGECHQYYIRGDLMYIEGHLTTRAWQDASQQVHRVTEVIAERVIILSRDPESPEQRDQIFIPSNSVREDEPYLPPGHPDPLMQRKLMWGI